MDDFIKMFEEQVKNGRFCCPYCDRPVRPQYKKPITNLFRRTLAGLVCDVHGEVKGCYPCDCPELKEHMR